MHQIWNFNEKGCMYLFIELKRQAMLSDKKKVKHS